MKYFKALVFAVIALIMFSGCSKEEDGSLGYTVEGLWEGNIGSGTQTPSSYFALYLRNNGTLERKNAGNSTIARGDFTLSGNTMTGKYIHDADGSLVTFTAVMDDTKTKLTGTWKDAGAGTGTWIIYKKQ